MNRFAQAQTDSLKDWIGRIKLAGIRGTTDTLALARVMSDARESLHYGEWSRLWRSRQIPFSKRKGEMLAVIGSGLEDLPAQNSAQLPSAWNTLYYVARLGKATVEELMAQRQIHAALTLQEAKALLAQHQPKVVRKKHPSQLKQRLTRFAAYVQANVSNWSAEERNFAHSRLISLAKTFEPDFQVNGLNSSDPVTGEWAVMPLPTDFGASRITLPQPNPHSKRTLEMS